MPRNTRSTTGREPQNPLDGEDQELPPGMHFKAPALGGQAATNQSTFDLHAPFEFISRLEFHKELGDVRQELTDMKGILMDVQTLIGRLSGPRDEERVGPRMREAPFRESTFMADARRTAQGPRNVTFEQSEIRTNALFEPGNLVPPGRPSSSRNRPANTYWNEAEDFQEETDRGEDFIPSRRPGKEPMVDAVGDPYEPGPRSSNHREEPSFYVIEQVVPGIARRDDTCLYRSPYPAYIDRDFPLPRGYRVPDFTRFSGEDEMTPLEHIARFTHQLGEAAGNDFWKLKLFPNSLTGDAFTWYASLPSGSVASWTQMQSMFVKTFARLDTPMSMFEVMRLRQANGEHPGQFLMKLRKALLRCRPPIPEKDQLLLALNALSIPFRKKLQGERFADLYDLTRRATEYYQLLTEEAKLTRAYQVDTYEVDVAEFVKGESTICDPLTRKNSKAKASQKNAEERKYSFDTDKVDAIFDWLYQKKRIRLKPGHRVPQTEREKSRNYCKWHGSFTHTTKDCLSFRNIIQDLIESKELCFPEVDEVAMVDDNPFGDEVAIHTFDIFDTEVNLVEVINDSAIPSQDLQATGETLVVNALMKRLAERGVFILPKGRDKWLCHWHLNDTHTTDQCHTFKKYLLDSKTEDWYDLTPFEEAAMSLTTPRGPSHVLKSPPSVDRRLASRGGRGGSQGHRGNGEAAARGTERPARRLEFMDSSGQRVVKQGYTRTTPVKEIRPVEEYKGVDRPQQAASRRPRYASQTVDPQELRRGPPIAQFLDEKLLCQKCKLIAHNRILITQLCTACCVNHFLRLVDLSAKGEMLVKAVRPEGTGNSNPSKPSSNRPENTPVQWDMTQSTADSWR
ncbi:hypothetical protein MLD38_039947 [Melastoma candidum]|uniref:Uncharacterized protein n=1 Tax=Melastoma candidum TaxID=119954 RepID=A0ACB9L455_9MYRT|nr:hypothetical protein MLD38_039947 [Melastoma candidum]